MVDDTSSGFDQKVQVKGIAGLLKTSVQRWYDEVLAAGVNHNDSNAPEHKHQYFTRTARRLIQGPSSLSISFLFLDRAVLPMVTAPIASDFDFVILEGCCWPPLVSLSLQRLISDLVSGDALILTYKLTATPLTPVSLLARSSSNGFQDATIFVT